MRLVEEFVSDLPFALRQLRKSPAFAAAGVLTLALGIGANTAVFSVVDAVLLRPVPFPEPERLVAVAPISAQGTWEPYNVSYPNFFDFRAENTVFEHLVCYRSTDFSLTGLERPVQVRGEIVGWDLFPLLKVKPALGRGFAANEEEPGARVAILSHELWRTRLGSDPSILGKTISLDREPYLIVASHPSDSTSPWARSRFTFGQRSRWMRGRQPNSR